MHTAPDLSFLGPPDEEPAWNQSEALALMDATDGAVERTGSRGLDPTVQKAAEHAAAAYAKRDMAGLRVACRLIVERVTELAARGHQHEGVQRGS